MSRPLRIEYEGAWYHVINRGAGRRKIFFDSYDYRLFLDLLKEAFENWNVETHSFSLMPNHYHLNLHTPDKQLSRALRHVNGVYTQRFNRRHKTDGPLFRGRYKDASDWYRIVTETGLTSNGEYRWAYNTLYMWNNSGKSLERLSELKQ